MALQFVPEESGTICLVSIHSEFTTSGIKNMIVSVYLNSSGVIHIISQLNNAKSLISRTLIFFYKLV